MCPRKSAQGPRRAWFPGLAESSRPDRIVRRIPLTVSGTPFFRVHKVAHPRTGLHFTSRPCPGSVGAWSGDRANRVHFCAGGFPCLPEEVTVPRSSVSCGGRTGFAEEWRRAGWVVPAVRRGSRSPPGCARRHPPRARSPPARVCWFYWTTDSSSPPAVAVSRRGSRRTGLLRTGFVDCSLAPPPPSPPSRRPQRRRWFGVVGAGACRVPARGEPPPVSSPADVRLPSRLSRNSSPPSLSLDGWC